MPNNSSKAFSLIELLFVVSIISVMLVSTMIYAKKSKFETDVNLLQRNAEQLGQSLNLYYYKHCRDFPKGAAFNQTVTIADLENEQLLPPGSFKVLPWVSFTMAIRSDISWYTDYNLWVFATINESQGIIDYIKAQLDAVFDIMNPGDTKKIGWVRLPSQKVSTMETANWVMGAGLQEFNNLYQLNPNNLPCTY